MEKKAEDYFHLYLGCDCKLKMAPHIGGLSGTLKIEFNLLCAATLPTYSAARVELVLLLRPLADMTEIEMGDIWDIIFKKRFIQRYAGRTVFIDKSEKNEVPRWVMNSGVERLGIEFDGYIWADSDLHKWDFNPHEVTKYLLSKSFDLFGLIECGIAIDKTKI
jgi:hypothetical protein